MPQYKLRNIYGSGSVTNMDNIVSERQMKFGTWEMVLFGVMFLFVFVSPLVLAWYAKKSNDDVTSVVAANSGVNFGNLSNDVQLTYQISEFVAFVTTVAVIMGIYKFMRANKN